MRRILVTVVVLLLAGGAGFYLGARLQSGGERRGPPMTAGPPTSEPSTSGPPTSGPPTRSTNPFGIFFNPRVFGLEDRVRLAQQLGVRYFRSFPVLVPAWNGQCSECAPVRDAGLEFVLTIRNSPDIESPASPASNIAAFKQTVGEILDQYRPALVAVENEEDVPPYWNGSPEQYIRQLQAVCEVAHERQIKCANGGLLGEGISWLVYQHHIDAGRTDEAASFARRALTPRQQRNLTSPAGQETIRQIVAHERNLVTSYKDAGADYINFHWYIADPEALGEAVAILEELSGLPAMTNEIGQRDEDPVTTRALLQQVLDLGLPYAVWFSSDARLAKALVNNDGSLRANGEVFASFIDSRLE